MGRREGGKSVKENGKWPEQVVKSGVREGR